MFDQKRIDDGHFFEVKVQLTEIGDITFFVFNYVKKFFQAYLSFNAIKKPNFEFDGVLIFPVVEITSKAERLFNQEKWNFARIKFELHNFFLVKVFLADVLESKESKWFEVISFNAITVAEENGGKD